jgi:hypothetical protein
MTKLPSPSVRATEVELQREFHSGFYGVPAAAAGRLAAWTVPMACIWGATRDIDAVALVETGEPDSEVWLFADDLPFWHGAHTMTWHSHLLMDAGHEPLPSLGVALFQLQEQAVRGTIIVRGLLQDEGKAEAIPPDAWANLQIQTWGSVDGFVAAAPNLNRSASWWSRLRLLPDELLKIWPLVPIAGAQRPADGESNARLTVDQREKARRPHMAKASQAEHDRQYAKYRDACVAAGNSPNVNDDEAPGRDALGGRFDRDKWRDSRRRLKAKDWSSTGKRKGKLA